MSTEPIPGLSCERLCWRYSLCGSDVQQESLARGETLFGPETQTDAIYVMAEGVVKLGVVDAKGDLVPTGLAGPGCIFASGHSLIGPSAVALARALTQARLCVFPAERIEAGLRSGTDAPVRLAKALARRLRQAEEFAAIRSDPDHGRRLRKVLEMLGREFGRVTPEGVRLSVRFTHEELAELISSTRSTVTRLLGRLEAGGWLTTARRGELVLNPSLLDPPADPELDETSTA